MPFLVPFFTFLGAKIAAAKVALIVSASISAGTALVNRLLRPVRNEALDGATSTIKSEIVPARWILGEGVLVPGALVYFGSDGREARMALVLGEGECGRIANRVKIDGQMVPLARVTSGDGDLLTPLADSKYYGKIEIREYFRADGLQGSHMRTAPPQTYEYDQGDGSYEDDPNYETEFQREPGQQDEPFVTPFPEWGADHQLQGLSWVYVRLTQPAYGQDIDKRFWTRVPNLQFLVDGLKITWPSQAAPTLTSNAAAVRYWWETERRGRIAAAIDGASFAAAYALSDEDVDATNGGLSPLPSGYSDWPTTSKRYSIRGVFASGDDVGGVEDQLDAAWAGEVVESAGRLYFRPGAERAALLSIEDAQIIEPPVARPWPALQARVNALTGAIPQSSQHDWSALSLPQVPETVSQAALERDGGKRSEHVRLAYIADPLAAGRLLAVALRRGQESLRVDLVCLPGEGFEYTGLIPTDRVLLTNAEYGLQQARMEVERVLIRQDGAVALTVREDLDGTFDDTLVLPPLEPRVIRLEDERQVPAVVGLDSDEIAETGIDGVTVIHLLVSWDAADAREIEINVRTRFGFGSVWDSFISVGLNLRVPGVVAGETYRIRGRHWNRRGVAGEWSATHENTIDGDLTPPGQMPSLGLDPLPLGYRATWENPADADFALARVYAGGDNSFSTAVLVAEVSADYYVATGLPAGTAYYVWVRAVDASGNAGQVRGPVKVTPTQEAAGSMVFDIGSAAQPDPDLGNVGDVAINDEGEYWLKTATGWVLRGDLTGAGSEVHFIGSATEPAADLGNVGDTAISDNGEYWLKTAGGWVRQGNLTIGNMVHDIGSATEPAADLGNIGDTAINDGGMYWLKTITGWVLRGDLTPDPGSEVYFYGSGEALTTFPPPPSFGADGDIAIGPDGRVLRKVSGAWVDVELDIPAPTGVSAVVTILASDILNVGGTVYDLHVQWVGANYLTEIEIGFIPSADITNLTGAAWGHFDGVSGTSFHDFLLIRQAVIAGRAVRARHIGSFGQRGPWAYALYSTVDTLAIDSFAADNTVIEPGDTVTLTWTMRNADSASIDQGVGALAGSELDSGSRQVNPTVTTIYTLTATLGSKTLTASVTVTLAQQLAQPSITSFAPDDSTLSTTQTTTVRWQAVNGVSGTITGPGLNRSLTTVELTAGTQSIGPLAAGNHTYRLRISGAAGTTAAVSTFSVAVDAVTIDSFSAADTTLGEGQSTVLQWTTSNADTVRLDGSLVSDDGSQTVFPPVGQTEYTLVATGPGGPLEESLTITVTSGLPVTIDSFAADDTEIGEGESTVLRWQTSNADTVRINNGSLLSVDGSMTVSPSLGSTTYQLVATGVDGPVNRSVVVFVLASPPVSIDSFTRNPATIEFGESSILSWTTSNATSVRLDGALVNADGSMTVSPTSDQTYTLVAFGSGGPVDHSLDVSVNDPPDPAPSVVSFTRSASTIDPGDSVVISWVTANGDTRQLSSSPPQTNYSNQAASGSRTFTPSVSQTYQIQVWNASDPSGTLDSSFLTVTVRVPDVM